MAKEKRVPLYVDILESLRARLDRVREINGRTLGREVERALRSYLDAEERRIEEESGSSDN